MQDGLHVGLAAWVSAQRKSPGFVVWPSIPFSVEPTLLENAATMANLKKVAEFARMVNFQPAKGQYAEPFATAATVWEVHRALLEDMEFATRPWTQAESEAWQHARSVLYETGPEGAVTSSSAYRLYDEYRIAYGELLAAGASAEELQKLLADWSVLGQKVEVEAAVAAIGRLAQRSSIPTANAALTSLNPTLLLSTDDDSYAPTSFAPLSAIDPTTWLKAEATLEQLGQAVGDQSPRGKWDAWRGARTGMVRFSFTSLEIRRPWFDSDLYEADDWRLRSRGNVSTGNGVDGELPAIVVSVYLVRLEDVRIAGNPPVSTPPPVVVLPPNFVRTVPTEIRRHPSVATRIPPVRSLPKAVKQSPIRLNASSALSGAERVLQLPTLHSRSAVYGRVNLLTQVDAQRRLNLATAIIGTNPPQPPAEPAPVYVVGFGCQALPASPQPNPQYLWPTQ